MSAEIWTILGVGVAVAALNWRVVSHAMTGLETRLNKRMDRFDGRLDDLSKDHQNLARELSELRGEIRGRFGKPEIQRAE